MNKKMQNKTKSRLSSLNFEESKQIFNKNGSEVTNALMIGTNNKSVQKQVTRETYRFVKSDGKIIGIKCLICEVTSYMEDDIKTKYCGRCHKFHEDNL